MPRILGPDDRRRRTHDDPALAELEASNDENSRESLDRRLDEGLKETFPASDPVSVMIAD